MKEKTKGLQADWDQVARRKTDFSDPKKWHQTRAGEECWSRLFSFLPGCNHRAPIFSTTFHLLWHVMLSTQGSYKAPNCHKDTN